VPTPSVLATNTGFLRFLEFERTPRKLPIPLITSFENVDFTSGFINSTNLSPSEIHPGRGIGGNHLQIYPKLPKLTIP
jgi:hypothetical protein